MIKTLEKTIQGESLIFTNRRAVFWPREKSIIISDLHVGKSAHFRKSGIAVTSQILLDDLAILADLIQYFEAAKVIIVGDLFHAGHNSDLEIFCEWRKTFADLDIILVKGNHDRIPKKFYEENCISAIEPTLDEAPYTFVHEPVGDKNKFAISGHVHPGIVLQGRGRQAIKLPCYAVSDYQLVLPAFSRFTGLDTKSLRSGFRHIAFSEGTIFDY